METTRARLMPERQPLRFIVRPGAVQHQNGARGGDVVRGSHIFVAHVRGWGGESTQSTVFVSGNHGLAQATDFDQFLTHFAVAFAVEQQ